MKKILIGLFITMSYFLILGCSNTGYAFVSRFEALRNLDYFETEEDNNGLIGVYSVINGSRRLIFSRERSLYCAIQNKYCIYSVDEALSGSTYSRQRIFLIRGDVGEIIDLGVHMYGVIIGNYVVFEKYYGEQIDENLEIEIFSIIKRKFECTVKLTELAISYLGNNWHSLLSPDLGNRDGKLLVSFQSEGTSVMDVIVDLKTKEYKMIYLWNK